MISPTPMLIQPEMPIFFAPASAIRHFHAAAFGRRDIAAASLFAADCFSPILSLIAEPPSRHFRQTAFADFRAAITRDAPQFFAITLHFAERYFHYDSRFHYATLIRR